MVLCYEPLATFFYNRRVLIIIPLYALPLASAEILVRPEVSDMFSMEMEMFRKLHSLDIGRIVVPAVKILMVADEWSRCHGNSASRFIVTICQMVHELIDPGRGVLYRQVIVHPFSHRRSGKISRH